MMMMTLGISRLYLGALALDASVQVVRVLLLAASSFRTFDFVLFEIHGSLLLKPDAGFER
jgi:hypothetical protein